MSREPVGRNSRTSRERVGWPTTDVSRGQLVLLVAALAALALVPIAVAYVQLGAHPSVTARTDPGVTSERVLGGVERAVVNASIGVSGVVPWDDRAHATGRFLTAFTSDVRRIERAALNHSTLVRVERNASAASAWARAQCPRGDHRSFDDCRVRRGVVLQNRTGATHVLAVGLDVHVADRNGRTRLTLVVTV